MALILAPCLPSIESHRIVIHSTISYHIISQAPARWLQRTWVETTSLMTLTRWRASNSGEGLYPQHLIQASQRGFTWMRSSLWLDSLCPALLVGSLLPSSLVFSTVLDILLHFFFPISEYATLPLSSLSYKSCNTPAPTYLILPCPTLPCWHLSSPSSISQATTLWKQWASSQIRRLSFLN